MFVIRMSPDPRRMLYGIQQGLKLTGLFSAERVKRAARTGRNPRTGETIEIPATYGVRISAGSLLKKAVTK